MNRSRSCIFKARSLAPWGLEGESSNEVRSQSKSLEGGLEATAGNMLTTQGPEPVLGAQNPHKTPVMWDGEMAWRLRACTALPKDQSSIPTTHSRQLTNTGSSNSEGYTHLHIVTNNF